MNIITIKKQEQEHKKLLKQMKLWTSCCVVVRLQWPELYTTLLVQKGGVRGSSKIRRWRISEANCHPIKKTKTKQRHFVYRNKNLLCVFTFKLQRTGLKNKTNNKKNLLATYNKAFVCFNLKITILEKQIFPSLSLPVSHSSVTFLYIQSCLNSLKACGIWVGEGPQTTDGWVWNK